MVNTLSTIRADIAQALNDAGIRAVDYAETRVVPPIAVVIPDDNYILFESDNNVFGSCSVGIQVMILGPKAQAQKSADEMDNLIFKALEALNEDFDVTSVSAPGEGTLNGVSYFGTIIQIEAQIQIGKD